jgi:glucan-binding YG repeat protein
VQPPAAAQPPPAQPAAAPQQQAPAQPAEPAAPAQAAEPEHDYATELAAAKTENARIKAETEQWKRQARNQEARSKKNHEDLKGRDALLRQIADKVGIEFDDAPDPAELTRKLDEAQATAKARTVELAVYTTAATAGAAAGALLDSREFMRQTEQLDPESADFPSQVAELVKAAATQPRYQSAAPRAQVQEPSPVQQPPAQPAQQAPPVQPPAPSSGSDFSGAPGGNRLWTQADYDHWTAPGMDRDGKVMTKAIADGLLVNLGVGKPKTRGRR